MIPNQNEDSFTDRLISILDRMCFVSAEPTEQTAQFEECTHGASLSFQGNGEKGNIELRVSSPLLDPITTNLLGLDLDEISDSDQWLALRELVQLACQEWMADTGINASDMSIGLPCDGHWEAPTGQSVYSQCFDSLNGLLQVQVGLDR